MPQDFKGVPIPPNQPFSAAQLRGERHDNVRYVFELIARKHAPVRVATGNAFGKQAEDPAAFAHKLEDNRFFAWDYISAGAIVGPDRVTPNEVYERVRGAMRRVGDVLRVNAARKL